MENREMPILHKSSGLWPKIPAESGIDGFCLSSSPDKQKIMILSVLRASAVKNNLAR